MSQATITEVALPRATRQPVLDANQDSVAYEIAFGVPLEHALSRPDARAELHALLEALADRSVAWFPVTRDALSEGAIELLRSLDASRLAFVIPADVARDPELTRACVRLVEGSAGACIDLDGPAGIPGDIARRTTAFRVDWMRADHGLREACLATCRATGARPAASNVETRPEFAAARDAGFELFQGMFMHRPEPVDADDVPGFKVNTLRFFRAINEQDIDFERLEDVIKSEVSISVKLLKHLNTAAFNWRKEVTSIRQALVLMGERPIRQWASVIAVNGLGADQPPELAATCLVRARFCELMASWVGLKERQFDLFFTGMLSAVDVMVGRPMAEVLAGMAVRDEVREALLGETSLLGEVLSLAIAHELGAWDEASALARALDVPDEATTRCHADAVAWAREILLG